MRLQNRKPGKYTFATFDPVMSEQTFLQLKEKLQRLKTVSRPSAIKETKSHAENGDFSENAEYQIAKGRLRGINAGIDELEKRIAHAIVLSPPQQTHNIETGHTVELMANGNLYTFTILGEAEADPARGIISYRSPLGAALIGCTVGDAVSIGIGTPQYTIEKIYC